MEFFKESIMKKTIITVLINILILFMDCGNYDNRHNPRLIRYLDAKTRITLAAMVKCSESGGNTNNYVNVESFVNLLFSGSSTISTTDRKDLYFNKKNVTDCVLEIMSLRLSQACDFSEFSSYNYLANNKLCNLSPDRSVKLDIISTN